MKYATAFTFFRRRSDFRVPLRDLIGVGEKCKHTWITDYDCDFLRASPIDYIKIHIVIRSMNGSFVVVAVGIGT